MIRLNAALGHRLPPDFREYISFFAYLYVCFGALLVYKTTILQDYGIDYAPFGLAAAKALLLAKFFLIGRKLHVGTNMRTRTPIHAIGYKSVLFLLLLLGLSAIEQVTVRLLHNDNFVTAVGQFWNGRLGEELAGSLLLLLILVPYFAYKELDGILGDGRIRSLLWHRV